MPGARHAPADADDRGRARARLPRGDAGGAPVQRGRAAPVSAVLVPLGGRPTVLLLGRSRRRGRDGPGNGEGGDPVMGRARPDWEVALAAMLGALAVTSVARATEPPIMRVDNP